MSEVAHLKPVLDLISAGRDGEAESVCRQVLQARPTDAWAMQVLGVIARQRGRLAEAIALMRYSIHLENSIPEFHNNLGTVEAALGQKAEAESAFRAALALQPDHPQAATNLANVLREQRRLDEAEQVARGAVSSRPHNPEAHNVLGTIVQRLGKHQEALACFEEAVRLAPDYVQGRVNRATMLLMHGDYHRGWREYEWRLRQPKPEYQRPWARPQWDGSDPRGKTLLLHCEGGFGNIMQFLRFASVLKSRGAHVILECPKPLIRLAERADGVDRVVEQGNPLPVFDFHIPLMSLPAAFATTLDTIPAKIPYLHAETALVAHFQKELQRSIPGDSMKVGLAWQGNPSFPDDATRSLPLAQFMPLTKVKEVSLINLQHGPARDQAKSIGFSVLDISGPPEPSNGAMINSAALISQLDLVITSDTSIAHLAGALGKPVWVALSLDACWRWLRGRDDTPWYPTTQLFRQRHLGHWTQVMDDISEVLVAKAIKRGISESIA
jgi:Flp pilus assembly protein TadD